MFIDTTKVPLSIEGDPENRIYIRPKMDFGTRARVLDAIARISATEKGATNIGVTMGAYQIALAVHNIVGWEGPAFGATPCTPETIQRLDPDEPLVALALEEIARRNPLGRGATRSSSTSAGAAPSTASARTPVASGTSTSPSPSDSDGRPRR